MLSPATTFSLSPALLFHRSPAPFFRLDDEKIGATGFELRKDVGLMRQISHAFTPRLASGFQKPAADVFRCCLEWSEKRVLF
jgi:hypothetical protein